MTDVEALIARLNDFYSLTALEFVAEAADALESLNRENQALATALEARIEPFVPWAATQ